MRRWFSRETFIALRARRQSHQIAQAIRNPALAIDRPPGPPLRVEHVEEPVMYYQYQVTLVHQQTRWDIFAPVAAIVIGVGFGLILWMLAR